jgi:hypothetical protein
MLHAGVDSLTDAIGYISLFRSHGHTINSVWFHTHGRPGYIHLPREGIDVTNAHRFSEVSGDLAPSAVVGFLGCNVAEGPSGEAFLLAAGSAMLGTGGGFMFASDSITFSVPGLGQRRPIWSSIKVVCVDRGGASRLC